jgi:hypothetical protein
MVIGSGQNERTFSEFYITPSRYGDNSRGKLTCKFHLFKGDDLPKTDTVNRLAVATEVTLTALFLLRGTLSWGFCGEFSCLPGKSFSDTAIIVIEKMLDALSLTGLEKHCFYHLLKISQVTYVKQQGQYGLWLSYKDYLLSKCDILDAPQARVFCTMDPYIFP